MQSSSTPEETMSITASGVSIDEIAPQIYRISVPFHEEDFTYNQFLIVDEEPLIFHTGLRATFPLVSEAIARVMPLDRLRYIAFSHFESDECGALNQFLAAAPQAVPLCSRVAAMTSVDDFADRPSRPLADGETLSLGAHTVEWLDTPHLPHGWEAGYLFEQTSRTLLCGDLFTHGGASAPALINSDLVDRAEEFRHGFVAATGLPDPYGLTRDARQHLERMAALDPRTLALMHGSSWEGSEGEAEAMLRAYADRLDAP
jgi:flavorubredoxin